MRRWVAQAQWARAGPRDRGTFGDGGWICGDGYVAMWRWLQS